MKKFGLFMYGNHYPRGGFNDFVMTFDSIDELKNIESIYAFTDTVEVIQIVNFEKMFYDEAVYSYDIDNEEYNPYAFTKDNLLEILTNDSNFIEFTKVEDKTTISLSR